MPSYVSSAEMAMLNSVLDEICFEQGYGPGPKRDFSQHRLPLYS